MWRGLIMLSTALGAALVPSPALLRQRRAPPVLCTAAEAASEAAPTLSLAFDNEVLRRLAVQDGPAAPPRQVRGAHFVRVAPIPLDSPKLVAVSEEALALLGVDVEVGDNEEGLPTDAQAAIFARCFSGNALPPGAEPAAHCYCGHQFGTFAGQLGDGAAMYLGEVVGGGGGDDGGGGAGERWELQLKGAGLTPFSRNADGRKVLRSSLREFLCSEAMHHLGIPTTRAAALVTSDSRVMRDVLRNGNAKEEHCAVVARVARSFLRFGSFEVCRAAGADGDRAGPSAGLEREMLVPLVDYAVEVLFPALGAAHASTEARCAALLAEAVARTARLVAAWQAVGFVHGVLNTDNMALTGDTIDYGPFGFLNCYDEDCTPNTSDAVRAPPPAPRPASSLVPDRSSPDAPPSLSRAVRCAATRTPTSRARATSTCSGSPRRWRRCCPRRRRRAISTPSGRRLRRSGTTAGFKGRRPCRRAAPHLPPQDHRKAQAAPTQPGAPPQQLGGSQGLRSAPPAVPTRRASFGCHHQARALHGQAGAARGARGRRRRAARVAAAADAGHLRRLHQHLPRAHPDRAPRRGGSVLHEPAGNLRLISA